MHDWQSEGLIVFSLGTNRFRKSVSRIYGIQINDGRRNRGHPKKSQRDLVIYEPTWGDK